MSRFGRSIASRGYIVIAPSSYHEFTGPEPLAYDGPGTDAGNIYKVEKTLAGYDEDARLAVGHALSMGTCNGQVGTTGMCLGGHLAFRCAVTEGVSIQAGYCYFATDLHGRTLGKGKNDDSLARAGELKAEMCMVFGKKDTHVPREGRDWIRKKLEDEGTSFSLYEIEGAQHAFIRDEMSKGRYDAAVTGVCFEMMMELFERTLKIDLGPREGGKDKIEDLC